MCEVRFQLVEKQNFMNLVYKIKLLIIRLLCLASLFSLLVSKLRRTKINIFVVIFILIPAISFAPMPKRSD